ncbi:MAG: YraN family protein [Rhodoplanes sp.]
MTGRIRQTRRRARRFGRIAEACCAGLLRLKGFRIIARDFKAPVGEIDIIARKGRLLAFIEVKARHPATEEVLTARQRKRIIRAAEAFMMTRPDLAGLDLSFDLMLVDRWRRPRHLVGAWRPDR